MSLEDSINTLALAIEQLADAITREKREPAAITIVKANPPADPPADPPNPSGQTEALCMDTAGVPLSSVVAASVANWAGIAHHTKKRCETAPIIGLR